MLQLIVGEKRRFVRAVAGRRRRDAAQRLDMRHSHAQNCQFVRLTRQRVARGHHVAQLGDVRRHFVAPSTLDLAVVFAGKTLLHPTGRFILLPLLNTILYFVNTIQRDYYVTIHHSYWILF